MCKQTHIRNKMFMMISSVCVCVCVRARVCVLNQNKNLQESLIWQYLLNHTLFVNT